MDEELYLKQLSIQLKSLPKEEVDTIIADYTGYFSQARAKGQTDAEIIEDLGHPREIIQEILQTRKQKSSPQIKSRSVLLAIALIFFNVTIVLGPVIGLFGAYFGLFVAVIAFIISPLLTISKVVLFNGALFEMFTSIFLCGLGIIVVPYLITGAKNGYELLRKYIQWNINIVKGES